MQKFKFFDALDFNQPGLPGKCGKGCISCSAMDTIELANER